jgi:hypothetical protein
VSTIETGRLSFKAKRMEEPEEMQEMQEMQMQMEMKDRP